MPLKSFYGYLCRKPLHLLMIICGLLFFITSYMYVKFGGTPQGDEPHYLVISQTLLKYHSFNVMLDYNHGDYYSFYPIHLVPHVALNTLGRPVPIQDIGGPILWLIPYALLGRLGAVLFISCVSLLIVANIYLCLQTMGINPRYTFLVSLAFGIASPIYIYSHLTFVEPIGALVVAYVLRKICQQRRSTCDLVISALLLGLLPWVHIRFAILEIPLFAFLLFQVYQDHKLSGLKYYLAYFVPVILLFIALEIYKYRTWGTFNPGVNEVSHGTALFQVNPLRGMVGSFFDQEYGLLFSFPCIIFLLSGLILTFKKRNFTLYHALVLLTSLMYLVSIASLSKQDWTGGRNPSARFMIALLPLFAFYIAYTLQHIDTWITRIFFFLTTLYGFWYAIKTLLPPFYGFNKQRGADNTIRYVKLFGHYLTHLYPSFFHNIDPARIVLWIMLYFSVSLCLVYMALAKNTMSRTNHAPVMPDVVPAPDDIQQLQV